MADFKKQLGEIKMKLDEKLADYFQEYLSNLPQELPEETISQIKILNQVIANGGKRARGALVIKSFQLFGGDPNSEDIISAAMYIEIVHAFLLILDDIADRSDTRRGGASGHRQIETDLLEAKSLNYTVNSNSYLPESLAMTVSVMGQYLGENLLIDTNFPPELKLQAIRNFNLMILNTAYGQLEDITNTVKISVSSKDVLRVLKYKTGYYTYQNPLQLGANLAGANENDLQLLAEHAIPAGVAFQIQDDILGMFGDEEVIGKSNKDDAMEGKITLLAVRTREMASKAQLRDFNRLYGKHSLSDAEHKHLQEIMISTGALDYSKQIALELIQEGKHKLQIAATKGKFSKKLDVEALDYLLGIADYMIQRNV